MIHRPMRSIFQRLFTILVLLVLHSSAHAQATVDVVYLKNGSVIRGMIIEQVPNESLKIQTRDGSVFVYAISEVEKITKEEDRATPEARGVQRSAQPSEYVRSGFVNTTSLGIGLGVGNYSGTVQSTLGTSNLGGKNASNNYVRLETVNGLWMADGVISLGLGVGLEYYMKSTSTYSDVISSSHGQIPIFIDIRAIPIQGKLSPSFIIQAGYSIGVMPAKFEMPSYYGIMNDRIFMNGLEFAGGVGLHTEVSSSVAFNVSVMYDYQQLLYEIQWFDPYYGYGSTVQQNYDARFGALRISLGLAF